MLTTQIIIFFISTLWVIIIIIIFITQIIIFLIWTLWIIREKIICITHIIILTHTWLGADASKSNLGWAWTVQTQPLVGRGRVQPCGAKRPFPSNQTRVPYDAWVSQAAPAPYTNPRATYPRATWWWGDLGRANTLGSW